MKLLCMYLTPWGFGCFFSVKIEINFHRLIAWQLKVLFYNDVHKLNITAMPQETLNEREFELVNIIGAKLGSNQRDLSRIMDLSLGMINMLVRRMIAKGYIRINQLSKRKVEYLLTTKGFSEKTRK